MDLKSRRALLTCHANPDEKCEYIVSLAGITNIGSHGTFNVRLTYVPHLLVLDAESLNDYLKALSCISGITPEQSGRTILEDTNNELVPRWIRITLGENSEANQGIPHRCLFQDSQPNWSNSSLISAVNKIETG